jgi:transcriptional regulator NrdR family protein
MTCPRCGSDQNTVINTRHNPEHTVTRRQRVCSCCRWSWYTYETIREENENEQNDKKEGGG